MTRGACLRTIYESHYSGTKRDICYVCVCVCIRFLYIAGGQFINKYDTAQTRLNVSDDWFPKTTVMTLKH